MRRVSWAVALVGAIAAAGCGGDAKPRATTSAGAAGTANASFSVTVNVQGPGTVTDGADTCAADTVCTWAYPPGTAVTLTARASGSTYFNGWFGDCSSATATCTPPGGIDDYVVAYFSATPQSHPNFVDSALHGPAYVYALNSSSYPLQCAQCHGADLQGQGLAPSCSECHEKPSTTHPFVKEAHCRDCHTRANMLQTAP